MVDTKSNTSRGRTWRASWIIKGPQVLLGPTQGDSAVMSMPILLVRSA